MKSIIRNFFVEEDLKNLLGWMGIHYKKALKNRIMMSLISFFVCLFIGYYYNNFYLMIISVFVGIGVYKYQYFSTKKRRKKLIAIKRRMFPSFVKKLLILIRTNNIYNSLSKMIEYTDDPIKKYLIQLIEEIRVDKTITPFNNFSRNMEFIESYQVMTLLYTFSEHAMNKKHLISLESMISQLYDNEIEEVIETKKRLLWLYPNFTILTMLVMIFGMAIFMFISMFEEVKF
ncbi:MAG TPA: hypothetical protein PLT65_00775 [Bacilli bacterium]|nr:hypothetical protein [Bacilli bacterium]